MADAVAQLATLLRFCAEHLGREVPDGFTSAIESRSSEAEADLIRRGLDEGLLAVDGNYVRTRDPYQGTAWLVEGNPVHPCWEYLPHMAAYVELVKVAGVPPSLVRFETPDSELNLDLAVLTPSGRVVLLGEVKAKSSQLYSLLRLLPHHRDGDPGKAKPIARGGPAGSQREAWKLAHQLWVLRPAFLWLVAPGDRRAFAVKFAEGRFALVPIPADLAAHKLPREAAGHTPRIALGGEMPPNSELNL